MWTYSDNAAVFIFSVVPIIFSIVMSFYNYNGFPGAPFVGLANYKMLFQDPEFLGALKIQ